MYQNSIRKYEPVHFGNEWGFYVDIENYDYNIEIYTNKIIKRNQINNNTYGTNFDYDYDFDYSIFIACTYLLIMTVFTVLFVTPHPEYKIKGEYLQDTS